MFQINNHQELANTEPDQLLDLANHFFGKLLTRHEIPLQEPFFQQLLSSACFTPTPSIIQRQFYHECQRCYNRKRSLFATLPCISCKEDHVYCRKCILMGRVIECEPLYYWSGVEPIWPEIENPCAWTGKLTDAQEHAARRISTAVINRQKELLVWGVCGSGKTEMLFPAVTLGLERGQRICIATPRTDVVHELLPRFSEAFPSVRVQGLYGGGEKDEGRAQIVITTTHQLLRYKGAFEMMVIDEIDAFPYHADPMLPLATQRAKKRMSTTIYLTATPRRKQRIRLQWGRLPHVFVPIRYHGYPLPVPRLQMSFSLKRDLANHQPPACLLNWLDQRENKQRQLLIFVPTIPLAKQLSEQLAPFLININNSRSSIDFVHAEDHNREEKITMFRENKTHILLTTTILERGVTFPAIDVAVLDAGHIVFDEAALVQIAGRAGRSHLDPTGEVVFFHDGKTNGMYDAIDSIHMMNHRGGL